MTPDQVLYQLHLGEKNLDIIASSINYTYEVNKMQNSILNIPWFHTPSSHFSRNGDDTMGDISEQKLAMTNSSRVFGGIYSTHPSPDILTKQSIKETASKGIIWGLFCIPQGGVRVAVT